MSIEIEAEAAAFRHLLEHLRTRSDVQNIDLMNLAGFCRNCLADWYRDAAGARGLVLDKDSARERVYGMPVAEWKARHQREASPGQQAQFDARHAPPVQILSPADTGSRAPTAADDRDRDRSRGNADRG